MEIEDLKTVEGGKPFLSMASPQPRLPRSMELVYVGWLARHVPSRGVTPDPVIERLFAAYHPRGLPCPTRAPHACQLCSHDAPNPPVVRWRERTLAVLGHGHHAIHHDSRVYVCPRLLLHYIVDHGYRPPDPFCEAVIDGTFVNRRGLLDLCKRPPRGGYAAEIDITHPSFAELTSEAALIQATTRSARPVVLYVWRPYLTASGCKTHELGGYAVEHWGKFSLVYIDAFSNPTFITRLLGPTRLAPPFIIVYHRNRPFMITYGSLGEIARHIGPLLGVVKHEEPLEPGFSLHERLGAGRSGEVYRTEHETGHVMAMKILHPSLVDTDARGAALMQRVRAFESLSHPSIRQIWHGAYRDGVALVIMELIDGRDLEYMLQGIRPPWPLPIAAYVIDQVCAALAFAHAATTRGKRPLNVVLGGITPANILLSRTGAVKLADFANVRLRGIKPLTPPHPMLGDFVYMAPEQIHDRPFDARADIFGAGALLYELVTGNRIFTPDVLAAEMYTMLDDVLDNMQRDDPALPGDLVAVIRRAVAPDPAHRYHSAGLLREALARAIPDRADARACASALFTPAPPPDERA